MARLLQVLVDLPANLAKSIGRVVTRFSVLELRLSRLTYLALGVDPKAGRIAVRESNATGMWDIYIDLCGLRSYPIPSDKKAIRDAIEACQVQRNELAHGVWLRDPSDGRLFLRLTTRTWQPISGQTGKTKRTIMPEGREYGALEIGSLCDLISVTISTLEQIELELIEVIG